jgi:hypothetical protein
VNRSKQKKKETNNQPEKMGPMELLMKRMKACSTLEISDELKSELRQSIFEYELSYGLFKIPEIKRKLDEFKPPEDSNLAGRAWLCLAFSGLATTEPRVFHQTSLKTYLGHVKEQILLISHRDELEQYLLLYFQLETELSILACIRYYYFNDNGEEREDLDEACEKFRSACNKILTPLIKSNLQAGNPKDDLALERNLRLSEVMSITQNGVFYDDRFDRFLSTFNEDLVLSSAKQLVLEIQKSLYGIAKPPPGAASIKVQVQKRMKDFQQQVEEEYEQHQQEQMDPAHKKQRVMAATASSSSSTAAAGVPHPPKPMKKSISAASTSSPTPAPAPSPAVLQLQVRNQPSNRRQSLEETQPMSPALTSPTPSVRSKPKASPRQLPSGGIAAGRIRFTEEEDQALREGVAKHGAGRWKNILDDPEFAEIFRSVKPRTAVNLKDRWRNLGK